FRWNIGRMRRKEGSTGVSEAMEGRERDGVYLYAHRTARLGGNVVRMSKTRKGRRRSWIYRVDGNSESEEAGVDFCIYLLIMIWARQEKFLAYLSALFVSRGVSCPRVWAIGIRCCSVQPRSPTALRVPITRAVCSGAWFLGFPGIKTSGPSPLRIASYIGT